MPDFERPPIGSGLWKLSSIAPHKEPARERESKDEEDTESLGSISDYDFFINRLDIGLLSLRRDKGYSSRRYSTLVKGSELKGLSDGVKEFLQVNLYEIEKLKIQLSVQHEGGKESWISVSNQGRKVRFVFDRNEKDIYSQMLVNEGEEWRVESKTRDNTLRDTGETLRIFERLVDRAGSS